MANSLTENGAASVAQRLEQRAYNAPVDSSNLSTPTKKFIEGYLMETVELVCSNCGHDHIGYGEFTPTFCPEVEGFGPEDWVECLCNNYKGPISVEEYNKTHPFG